MQKPLHFVLFLLLTVFLTACVRKPADPSVDPYEHFNRAMFAFNMDMDHLLLRPAGNLYRALTPPAARRGVTNFFDNIDTVTTIPNDILQGKFLYAATDFWRLVINTTLGLGGVFDVATRLGLPKHYEDFGLTLSYWAGGGHSPYLMIPILGAATFRSGYGRIYDIATTPWTYIPPWYVSFLAHGFRMLNLRAEVAPANKLLDNAFDPYVFIRSAYLQRRNRMVEENLVNKSPRDAHRFTHTGSSVSSAISATVSDASNEKKGTAQTKHAVSG